MATLLWLVNLFSVFSSFGALVVIGFIAVRSRRPVMWKLFVIILLLVMSYAVGMLRFLLTTGFAVPHTTPMDVIGGSQPVGFLLSAIPYVILTWLMPSTTNELLGISSRLIYAIVVPVAVLAILVPFALILLGQHQLERWLGAVAMGPLLLQAVLIEYPAIMIASGRSAVSGSAGVALRLLAIAVSVAVAPMMVVEDLLVIYRGWPVLNIAEAAGFLLLTSLVLVMGIHYIAASLKRHIEPASLLDVSRRYSLTERESQVMGLLIEGGTYKEISASLSISPDTVKTHVSRVYRKVGVSAKQELKYKIRDFTS